MTETRLIHSRIIAASTVEYAFERPADFTWRAGQFAYFVVPGAGDVQSDKPFTLSSVPTDDVVTIATRAGSSPFKRALAALRPGDPVLIDGPMGGFILGQEDRGPVWLAGGMGITPFRSMVREILASDGSPPPRAVLFYSTHTVEEAAYLDELRHVAAAHDWFTLVVTLTRAASGAEAGFEHGRIDEALLHRHLPSFEAHSWFIERVPRGRIRLDPFVA